MVGSIAFAGVRLHNPLVLASGIAGVTVATLQRAAKNGAGAVTLKSIGLKPRTGHPNPTVIEWEAGVLNAVGLSTPGLEKGAEELRDAVKRVKAPVIASIFADSAANFGVITEKLVAEKPALLEANLSCPNVMREHGVPFAYEPESAAEVIREVKNKAGGIPIIAKLSPNTHKLKAVARAVEEAGADAINMGNTLGPGMLINLEARKPVLSNKMGGVSGLAIRPIAVRCVWDVYESVKIPIMGTGGVSTGRDALEMMMAGASAVGIGTAVYERGFGVFRKVEREMDAWMKENKVSRIEDLVGAAHA